ncbi:unnamed protein product [Pleuronectes platessa]|uniref:Uncharacterized protein n=1 Tax=Pleuronectes platessa TaxID=8262 RepID=A0A9N7U4V0_PLEPL|nr:unnamed protein product [Pleuronectes platessa]
MVYNFTKCTMSTKGGKSIVYKRSRNSWKMLTKDGQDHEENASMDKSQRERKGKIQFALRFKRDQLYYSPAVAMGELKMEKTPSSPASLGQSYWFEKENIGAGEYHALRSVSEPQYYLCSIGKEISTCTKKEKSLHVKVKMI